MTCNSYRPITSGRLKNNNIVAQKQHLNANIVIKRVVFLAGMLRVGHNLIKPSAVDGQKKQWGTFHRSIDGLTSDPQSF
jgi:hypothetical protein